MTDDKPLLVHECFCGSGLFNLVVSFQDYEISGYFTEMTCLGCGQPYTAPTPIDDPSYVEGI